MTFEPTDHAPDTNAPDTGDARATELSGAIGTLKAALGDLETACRTIVGSVVRNQHESVTAAFDAARRIAEAESQAEAAIQRARLQADIDVMQLRRVVERLEAKLAARRTELEPPEPSADAGLRAPADAAVALLASYRAQMASMRDELDTARLERDELAAELEAEKAKRARLIAAIQLVRQPMPAWGTPDWIPTVVNRWYVDAGGSRSRAADEAAGSADPSEYAQQLCDEVEAQYVADVESGVNPCELVDQLTKNLVEAGGRFAAAYGDSPQADGFDRQLMSAIDRQRNSLFGRHLAVAVYECERHRNEVNRAAQVA